MIKLGSAISPSHVAFVQRYLAHGAPDSSDGAFPLPAPTGRIGFVEPGIDEGRKVFHISRLRMLWSMPRHIKFI